MVEKYITHNVLLESADFYVLILEFPETDVNDKLSVLASEKGLIYRHLYEDFVIGTCMANAGPFFYHIRKRAELIVKLAEIRKEALDLIFRHSPGFKPENIVINQNNILKTKSSVRAGEKGRALTSNDLWDQDPPLSNFGPAIITSTPYKTDDNPFREDDEDAPLLDAPPAEDVPDNPFSNSAGGGNVDVPYELVGHKWDRLGLYVNVRKYEESDAALVSLLGGSPFESTRGYHILVVERCVEDFSDVFQLLDQLGISEKIKPEILMEELYAIVIEHNPFLKLESVDLKSVRTQYKTRERSKIRNNRRIAQSGSEDKIVSSRKRKRFADLSKETLISLADKMKQKVVGQDEAIHHIADAVQRASVGLKRPHEPLGVLLFTGNTGVGKTETAKVLADCLEAPLVRIDCQDYQQPHESAKLAGSPPGYVGYDDGGHLTKEVSKSPFSVILFDEIEKAHSNFHDRILQIIDDGELTDNKGKKVPFNECVIIMTSNIGVAEVSEISRTLGFGDVSVQTDLKSSKARDEALKQRFKPEFLNRVDEIVHFRKLEKNDYLSILDILLDEVKDQIQKGKGVGLNFSVAAKNFLLDSGIDKKYGARPLRRAIKRHLNTPLARAILSNEIEENSKAAVGLNPEKTALTFKSSKKGKKEEDAD
jgi:ATP-dependent protease Clp ATPase subunit